MVIIVHNTQITVRGICVCVCVGNQLEPQIGHKVHKKKSLNFFTILIFLSWGNLFNLFPIQPFNLLWHFFFLHSKFLPQVHTQCL